jgi:hypothetical protein
MMKKLNGVSIRFYTRSGLATLFLLGLVAFSACDLFTYKRPFPDAYYSANFIENIGFDKFIGDVVPVPMSGVAPLSGSWDFAYRYLNWDSNAYMTVTPSGSTAASVETVPSGLSATAPVYMLEVVNLINGGDFENNADGFSGYNGTWGGTGSNSRNLTTPLYATASMTLSTALNQLITFAPALSPGFSVLSSTYTYKAFFRYVSPDTYQAKVDSAFVSFDDASGSAVATFGGSGSAPVFSFFPESNTSFSNLRVDNFRLTRSGGMSLRLLLTIAETTPALESGVYSFSVWVHSDPAGFSDRSPYLLDSFMVTMRAVFPASLSASSAIYSPSAGWQKLTATLAPGALMFDSTDTSSVLELVVDCNNAKPGRVLLAQPELRFYPDGL